MNLLEVAPVHGVQSRFKRSPWARCHFFHVIVIIFPFLLGSSHTIVQKERSIASEGCFPPLCFSHLEEAGEQVATASKGKDSGALRFNSGVTSRLDYCNAFYVGLAEKLHLVWNEMARLMKGASG